MSDTTARYYGIYARNTGNWEYEMVWGDWLRVYANADDARHAASRLQSLVEDEYADDAPDGLEYFAAAVDLTDEISPNETVAEHLAATHADIIAGLP